MTTSPNLKSTKLILLFFFLVVFFTIPNLLTAQETVVETIDSTLFKTFQRDSLLRMTIKTATKRLVTKKYKEEWQPLEVSFTSNSAEPLSWDGKVRTRGNIRKQVCFFPPLKLKFKKKWLVKNQMDSSYNDLKLVIGCKKGDFYGSLVLKEYLIYRLYEALTDISFKTQLAEIEFIDTEDKWKPFTTYAFFIENQDEMATRLNAICTKPKRVSARHLYAEQLDRMNLFEYMIGNTDWSTIASHNIRLIRSKEYKALVPIAYDFDYAGLVNAPYAVHGEGIDLEKVTERLYLGICRDKGVLEKQIPLFQEKKSTFYQIIEEFSYLDKKNKKIMLAYLDDFYKTLDNPNRFKREILNSCREKGR